MHKITKLLAVSGITLHISPGAMASDDNSKQKKDDVHQTIVDEVKRASEEADKLVRNAKSPAELSRLADILAPLSRLSEIPVDKWEELDIDAQDGRMNHACNNSGCN